MLGALFAAIISWLHIERPLLRMKRIGIQKYTSGLA
jgi:hypothetical protein